MKSHFGSIRDWGLLAHSVCYRSRELARLCQVSPRQLERFFREQFGTTPQKWLDELRLKKAAADLLDGKHVKEVAYEFGFVHPSHFIRKFKRLHQCTPFEFIRTGGGY